LRAKHARTSGDAAREAFDGKQRHLELSAFADKSEHCNAKLQKLASASSDNGV
jgi:hypothetical protein